MTFFNIPQEEQRKDWFRLWKDIIQKRQECHNQQKSPLLMLLATGNGAYTWRSLKRLTEFGLDNAKNTAKIFSNRRATIKIDGSDQDDVIREIFTELEVIPVLKLLGFEEIVYDREKIDFTAVLNRRTIGIEATYIRCTNLIKAQDLCLKSKKLIDHLTNKYKGKEKQVLKYCTPADSIIFIRILLEEVDPFWLNHEKVEGKHPIQYFVDTCEIPIIILGPGFIPYISKKLAGHLLPLDRDKYIETAYGIDKKEIAKAEVTRQLVEKSFWRGYSDID